MSLGGTLFASISCRSWIHQAHWKPDPCVKARRQKAARRASSRICCVGWPPTRRHRRKWRVGSNPRSRRCGLSAKRWPRKACISCRIRCTAHRPTRWPSSGICWTTEVRRFFAIWEWHSQFARMPGRPRSQAGLRAFLTFGLGAGSTSQRASRSFWRFPRRSRKRSVGSAWSLAPG